MRGTGSTLAGVGYFLRLALTISPPNLHPAILPLCLFTWGGAPAPPLEFGHFSSSPIEPEGLEHSSRGQRPREYAIEFLAL